MSQSIQSGKTSVSGSVTTSVASMSGNALSFASGTNTSGSTPTTVLTVAGGRKYRIRSILAATSNYAASVVTGWVKIDGVIVIQFTSTGNATTPSQLSNNLNLGSDYIEIAATKTVTIQAGNNSAAITATIVYEDVAA